MAQDGNEPLSQQGLNPFLLNILKICLWRNAKILMTPSSTGLLGPQGQLVVHQTRRFTLLTMAMSIFDVCISNCLLQLKLNYLCKHWESAQIRLNMLQFLPSLLLSLLPGFILVQLLLEVQTKIYLKYLRVYQEPTAEGKIRKKTLITENRASIFIWPLTNHQKVWKKICWIQHHSSPVCVSNCFKL